ncbi:hypothetical protein H4F99_09860 [Lysobacter sp. SG-8]|uniref:Uncharacterized protein n=1 Tax=Marilutibacter penaei TaxID=2759900 RepID=A0A7W3U572_9GAMM|nr:hypothetical protein [Lysobacter penaei]MBB1088795.1 hypothetical protein [Lysobacter penaei]
MKELTMTQSLAVCGGAAGDIECEVSTDKVGCNGTLSDFGDLAKQYSKIAPFSGLGLIGLGLRLI